MRINNNLPALNTYRQLGVNNKGVAASLEKLSSGKRINKAGDDAAGLAISEKMRTQIRGLNQASRNAQDGVSMLQTAEGALNETHAILQRMRELVVQANNGTNNATDRTKLQDEIGQLKGEVQGIADRTEFNKQKLIDGSLGAKTANVDASLATGTGKLKISDVTGAKVANDYVLTTDNGTNDTFTLSTADGSLTQTVKVADITAMKVGDKITFDKFNISFEAQVADCSSIAATNTFDVTASGTEFQIGANGSQTLAISIGDMGKGSTGLDIDTIDVTKFDQPGLGFNAQLGKLDTAVDKVSGERAKIGSWQNRLDHTINNLDTSAENLTAAESRIRDVDMAKEMMEYTKNNILMQAAQGMLAQANQAPQGVLQLLR